MSSKTKLSKIMEAWDDGAYQRLQIPMSHVVSVAEKVHYEGKREKSAAVRKKRVKIIGENWSKIKNVENDKTIMDNTSEDVKEQEFKKYGQCRPVSYSALTQYYREQCQWIKKPRKQVADSPKVSAKKMSAVKRRPMTVPAQNMRYVDKDVSLALLSSQDIVKQVQRKMDKPKQNKSEAYLKKVKINNFLQGIPRFSHIDDEFQDLCKSKAVDKIISSSRETTKNEMEKLPKNKQSSTNNFHGKENDLRCKLPVEVEKKRKPMADSFHRRTAGQQFGFPRSASSCYSRKTAGKIQVPKNIYIREAGRDIIENLVEVRNQDDLDVLNTLTTLHPLKCATKPVKLFEHLRDSEVYYYPII